MPDSDAVSEPLIGRAAEVRRLQALLDSLDEGGGGAFLEVVGEAGIGKTALLDELERQGESRRMLVLRGRAAQIGAGAPFDPFVDALDDYLASLHPRLLEPLGEDRIDELASAFPSLAELAASPPATLPSEERYRLHRAVRSLLGAIAKPKPLLLVLDDAHWSDHASLELLSHLVRRPPGGPVMVAIAYRTGTMPDGWEAMAGATAREGELLRVELGPLSREDAYALLGSRVDDEQLRSRVFDAAGGNPFFLKQVAEVPEVVSGVADGTAGREGVPRAVVAAISEEVAALEAPAREALQGAAVAGDPFDPADAAAAAGIEESELLRRLDELTRRGLVRPGASPREFQFRHPLVWRGVYEDAPAGGRLRAHGRLAEHLAEQGAGAATRAPHIEAAAQPGDDEAVAVLRQAADAALSTAPASAIHWYEAALRLLPEDADPGERVSLLVPLAKTLGSVGRLAESRDRLRETLELIPPEAEAVRVEAVVARATMENLMRNLPEGRRLLTDALDSLSDPESEQAAKLLLALTTLHLFDFESDEIRGWGKRALDLAINLSMRDIEAAATGALSYNEYRIGNVPEALQLLNRAAPLVDSTDGSESFDPAAFFWVATAEMQLERFEDSVRHADRARELARSTGQGGWLPQLASVRAFSLWFLGRLDEAHASIEEAIEMAQLTGNKQFELVGLNGRMLIGTARGMLSDAMAAAQRAMEITGAVDAGDYVSTYSRQSGAYVALASGDPATARHLILETIDARGFPRNEVLWHPLGLGVITEAELVLGDIDSADRHARESLQIADAAGLAVRRSWALHAMASVQLASGEASAALDSARGAAEAGSEASARIDEGRALILAGRALAAAGDEQAGEEELRRAHDVLDSCGAAHFRDAAARELRRLGVSVRAAGRAAGGNGPKALSAREREVAELVAEGRTNKEIAEALFISPKTVDKHVSKAFKKLGVSRRAQVAAAIERERAAAA